MNCDFSSPVLRSGGKPSVATGPGLTVRELEATPVRPPPLAVMVVVSAALRVVGTLATPIAQLTRYEHGTPTYHAQKVALLLAAGADPKDIPPGAELKGLFQCAYDLRALGAFCGSGSLENASSPAARFVRSDGDMAIVHRVHGFIDVFKALLSF